VSAPRLWTSPLGPERVAAGALLLAEPLAGRDAVYWLQSRPAENGRVTVMRLARGGTAEPVVPAPWSVRSRVNEYGGGAWTLGGPDVWFVNDSDQALCRAGPQGVETVPVPIDAAFGDLEWDGFRHRILAVAEDRGSGRQRILAVQPDGTCQALAEGADFYAAPRLSPDGRTVVWLEWSEPDMPWDATRLMAGRLNREGRVRDARCVAGGQGESLCQPEWSPDGDLYVASDRDNGFWNLCRSGPEGLEPVRRADAECARPAFVFAQRLYAFTAAGGVLLAEASDGLWRCREGARDGSRMQPRLAALSEIAGLHAGAAGAVVIGGGGAEPLGVHVRWRGEADFRTVATSLDLDLDPGFASRPEPFEFESAEKARARALYFPPAHPRETPAGAPPLRLRCHGGPTAAASSALDPKTLYWTSRGFAVVLLNYRGSTGYGRGYREALYRRWGIADVEDALGAARALAAAGRCDPARMVVAGNSAGGFTALHALRGDTPFAAGAVAYGVADLTALANAPMRFEAHYGEKLVGPWPSARATYEARSPLHHAGEIGRPAIFFQGTEDPVVPPEQSESMVAALAARGVRVAYEVFPGERHGFRRPASVARTLAAELAFHAEVLGLRSDEALVHPAWVKGANA